MTGSACRTRSSGPRRTRARIRSAHRGRAGKDRRSTKIVNPSNPKEIIGRHHKATADLARRQWKRQTGTSMSGQTPSGGGPRRDALACGRDPSQRKFEFNAWLAFEAGKTWPEAEAETAEAIDFCEYYARQMLRFLPAEAPVQSGREGQLAYLPLGVGVVIPPWNFALAILAGMATAALVTGNTVIIKPRARRPRSRRSSPRCCSKPAFRRTAFRCWPAAAPRSATCWWSIRRRDLSRSPGRVKWGCVSMSSQRNRGRARSGSSA